MPVIVCRTGDTPSAIARRFSLSVEELCRLNALPDPQCLTEGLALFVPEADRPPYCLELLACPYEPLPPSVRGDLLPHLSWWADGNCPKDSAGAAPLLRCALWDESGAWSAAAAHGLLRAPEAADELCEAVEAGGFAGLYLLPVGLYAFDGPLLASFLPLLAAGLHRRGRYLLLGLDAEEAELFPYAEAADRIVLLSPARRNTEPLPRPNAPLDQLRVQLEAAAEALPAEKLLLGLSDYGTRWQAGEAQPISHMAALHRAVAAGLPIRWDARSGECCFEDGGTAFWLQDLRSVEARLALAAELGLAGLALQPTLPYNAGLWALLQSRCRVKTIAL